MMKMPILQSFFFQQPPSIFIKAMPVITLLSLSFLAVSEAIGNHLQYSKFWNVDPKKSSAKQQIKLSSRTGMLILYTPALLAGLASFWLYPDGDIRFLMVRSALTIHFFKRVLEVLFVHKYSGAMVLDSALLISFLYFISCASMIYIQHLCQAFSQPSIDLKYLGVLLFLVGICGNFYHHYLLSKLRGKDEKGYKIPKGGLFNLVICPHYLFEIVLFLGISFLCQTSFSFSCAIGSAFYLIGRIYATRKWYLSKFENFPKDVKALIPFVF